MIESKNQMISVIFMSTFQENKKFISFPEILMKNLNEEQIHTVRILPSATITTRQKQFGGNWKPEMIKNLRHIVQ